MEFKEFIDDFERECIDDAIAYLVSVGHSAYEKAVQGRAFQDRTHNLMSSIGWAVTHSGKVVEVGGFEGPGNEGRTAGLQLVDKAKLRNGLQLIFVAGMHYATHVESKGYDVNTAGELLIDEMMTRWAK